MVLSAKQPKNTFGGANELPVQAYSRGMGALGLPGDLSSESRFVRVSFEVTTENCMADATVLDQIIANFIADDVDCLLYTSRCV